MDYKSAIILLAAGSGKRLGNDGIDKVLSPLGGIPLILHSLRAFAESGVGDHFVIVYRDRSQQRKLVEALDHSGEDLNKVSWVRGGAERQDSVFHALESLPLDLETVFIHDCARPFIQPSLIQKLYLARKKHCAAVLAHRVTDTLKSIEFPEQATTQPVALSDLERSKLWAMETPQVFDKELITEAYRKIRLDSLSITDDTAALSLSGHKVMIVENPFPNPKLTYPADWAWFNWLWDNRDSHFSSVD